MTRDEEIVEEKTPKTPISATGPNWTERDLRTIVDEQVTESDRLDFKGCDSLRCHDKSRDKVAFELSKDVSALANCDGGTIIYGIKDTQGIASSLDSDRAFVRELRGEPNREWLVQKISSVVTPVPEYNVSEVELSDGRFALVVDVKKRLQGCQAIDKRYYRRGGDSTYCLSDWQVRELLLRRMVPDVGITLLSRVTLRHSERHEYRLVAEVTNLGGILIKHWALRLSLPGWNRGKSGYQWESGLIDSGWGGAIFLEGKQPLFPEQNCEPLLDDSEVAYAYTEQVHRCAKRDDAVGWTLYADDMVPKHGQVSMNELNEF